MHKLRFAICASIAVLLLQINAQAWNGAGHQVIAAEAQRQLSRDLEVKETALLKAHPDYGVPNWNSR